jgi:RNAse (barnase) inhibitor barstar
MDYAGFPGQEIADPWYTRDFERAYSDIALACEGLLYHLTGTVTVDFSLCPDIPSLYRVLRERLQWEDWYGENLDALYDVLTGLPHKGERFVLTLPGKDAPREAQLYARRIQRVFAEAGVLASAE